MKTLKYKRLKFLILVLTLSPALLFSQVKNSLLYIHSSGGFSSGKEIEIHRPFNPQPYYSSEKSFGSLGIGFRKTRDTCRIFPFAELLYKREYSKEIQQGVSDVYYLATNRFNYLGLLGGIGYTWNKGKLLEINSMICSGFLLPVGQWNIRKHKGQPTRFEKTEIYDYKPGIIPVELRQEVSFQKYPVGFSLGIRAGSSIILKEFRPKNYFIGLYANILLVS